MADDQSKKVSQDEIEELLRQAGAGAPAGSGTPAAAASSAPSGSSGGGVNQDEIEQLLGQASASRAATPAAATAAAKAAAPGGTKSAGAAGTQRMGDAVAELSNAGLPSADVELLLRQAEAALASADQPLSDHLPAGFAPYQLQELGGAAPSSEMATLELIRDVELDLKIELGRTHMYLEDVLKLRKGSVVPLDKLAGDPVDVYVNGRLIARGEVLVLNDNFCVRVAELIAGERPTGIR
jgi:flagellar motor switch protein FliN/FliY